MGLASDYTLYCAISSAMTCEVQGEMVILDVRTGTYFGLNPVASGAWRLLEHGATLQQLVDDTVSHFEVHPEQCEPELRNLLKELMGHGLVESGSISTRADA